MRPLAAAVSYVLSLAAYLNDNDNYFYSGIAFNWADLQDSIYHGTLHHEPFVIAFLAAGLIFTLWPRVHGG